jgi:hypothetical protein
MVHTLHTSSLEFSPHTSSNQRTSRFLFSNVVHTCTNSHEFFGILTAHEFYSKNKYYKWLKEQVYLRQIITEISRDPINIIASQCLIKGWRYKWSRFIQMP